MRSSRQSADKDREGGIGSASGLLQHVIAMSVGEVDQVIVELMQFRDHLQDQTNRVNSEIAGYTRMTQIALEVALRSAEAITQSLPQFRSAKPELGLQPNNVAPEHFEDL